MAGGDLPDWYVPVGGYLWDPWFHQVGGVTHLFHLFQAAPGGSSRNDIFPRDRPVIAHATWAADEGWTPRGVAVDYTGTAYDEDRIHTGCVIDRGGAFAMLYSGSNRFICLANSSDLDHWVKDENNPVMAPDPALYRSRWRDPWVLGGLAGEKYTVLVAAQSAHNGPPPVGVVGVAHSTDLVHWRQDSPLEVPPWFEWLEVPELHHLGGLWYLIFATRQRWITTAGRDALRARGIRLRDGAYYLTSRSLQGPYDAPGVLSEEPGSGYTTRLLPGSATEHRLWSHVEHDRNGRVVFALAPPRPCTAADGRLLPS